MYLPLAYINRYSLLTELYCDEEHLNCNPEMLIEMISDDNWGTDLYSGPNRERYMNLYNMFDRKFFSMHAVSACCAAAGLLVCGKIIKWCMSQIMNFHRHFWRQIN